MIKPTQKLKKDLKRLINESFDNALESIGEEEFFYVGNNIERKIQAVQSSSTRWVQDLATYNTAFYDIFKDHTDGILELEDEDLRIIGAALFYFVNPFDIIPDHIPGKGYLDDAYVANKAIKLLEKRNPGLIRRYVHKLRGSKT